MRQGFSALLLLCLGLGVAVFFAMTSLDPGDAQAAKVRKKPKKQAQPVQPSGPGPSATTLPPIQRTKPYARCPADMVNVAGRFCIDRWEASTIDADTGRPLSPHYPPHPKLANQMRVRWEQAFRDELSQSRALMMEAGVMPPRDLGKWDADPSRWLTTDASARSMSSDAGIEGVSASPTDGDAGLEDALPPLVPTYEAPHGWVLLGDGGDSVRVRPVMLLPILPPWQIDRKYRVMAVSRPNVRPQGYTPGFVADPACREAGKRLCREDEWIFACKGERQTKHPYGDQYRRGQCNVYRRDHPARILHGNFSVGHSDPRLNMMEDAEGLLLRDTGTTPSCKSIWGQDVIYDMVGNVDEWVDDPSGVFVGGFFSRGTRNGCEARIRSHPRGYFDYSTGFRCCADLAGAFSDQSDTPDGG